jgi:hypothetical protein
LLPATEDQLSEIITAVHESGHAVVSRLLEFPAGAASVIAFDDAAGVSVCATIPECTHVWANRGWATHLNLTPVQARIVVAMAGVAAEIEVLGDHCGGHESDWETINRLSEGDEELKQALWEYTCDLVHQYPDVIEVFAAALCDAKYLSGTEIDEIVEALSYSREPRDVEDDYTT